ncbi:hypothetical protein Poli38472_002135 [Pythium oligandrum]|uniref:Protein phosphatase n=1 Tax=Pythium oligandrum TaxID=41045 RepID=A0A8K1FJJ6_PYTOL|nr:hypothetical protein Poli38472_002135 [Pythium oligandrum]|eukprot:TMW63194.1 hypothetical protein Poli38472_002135 [Pythium oligandrum]
MAMRSMVLLRGGARLLKPASRVHQANRTFFSRAGGPRAHNAGSFSQAASSRDNSNGAAQAMTYFLDAQAACRNKRCRVGQPGQGIVANPEACGEDSYFMSPNILGVADGVGGWNENGVDPGEISRSLMRNASAFVTAKASAEPATRDVLEYAYARAVADEKVEAGSTTACLIRLKMSADSRPLLEYTNLGDSGFALIRDGAVVFRSKFQYYGRAPYQLAKVPPRFKTYGAIENQPSDADSGEIEVQDGDIIVLATDGVWDNFSSNLLSAPASFPPLVSWRRHWQNEVAGLVDVIAQDPSHAAQNIIKAALRHNLKPDDVTVIVAKVVRVAPKL